MKNTTGFKVFGFLALLITSFLVAVNVTAYQHPDEAIAFKEKLFLELDKQAERNRHLDGVEETILSFKASIECSLTEGNYRLHSLFRIIGCIVAVIGVSFLRSRKELGLHLFSAGMLFAIFTGFYAFGFSIIGLSFNVVYFLFFLTIFFFYYTKRHTLE